MRDSVHISSESRLIANTKNPSVPSSLPSAVSVSKLGARFSRWRWSEIGTQQPRAALANDPRRHDFMQLSCRQLQGFGYSQRGLEGQRLFQFRHGLAELYESFRPAGAFDRLCADLDDVGAGKLARDAGGASSQGQQHGVRGDGGVPDEGRFLACIEEAQPHVVIGAAWLQTRTPPRHAKTRVPRSAAWHRFVHPHREPRSPDCR